MAIESDVPAESALPAVDKITHKSQVKSEMTADDAVDLTVNEGPNELAIATGTRLRLIRERNGLSQRELAKRAAVTNSNISMIEQGLVSPSINSLARVLSGIPMSLAQFFAGNPLDVGNVVYGAATLERQQIITAGGAVKQEIAADKPRRKVLMARETYPSGCDSGAEPLCPPAEMSATVISGQLELTVGMQVYPLNAGDAFYLAPQQPYRIRNISAEEALVITTSVSSIDTADHSAFQ